MMCTCNFTPGDLVYLSGAPSFPMAVGYIIPGEWYEAHTDYENEEWIVTPAACMVCMQWDPTIPRGNFHYGFYGNCYYGFECCDLRGVKCTDEVWPEQKRKYWWLIKRYFLNPSKPGKKVKKGKKKK